MSTKENKLYWNKKDGAKVLISEMKDKDLLAAIKQLETEALEKHGTKWKTKIKENSSYGLLKLHAIGRDLINK